MLIGSTVATLSLALIASVARLAVYVVAMALFGAGSAFLSVAPSAVVGDVASGHGGTVIAAFQMSSDLGAVAGPLVAGRLADNYSFGAAFGVTAERAGRRTGHHVLLDRDATPGRATVAGAARPARVRT